MHRYIPVRTVIPVYRYIPVHCHTGFCGRKKTLNHAHSLSLICQPTSEDMKLYIINGDGRWGWGLGGGGGIERTNIKLRFQTCTCCRLVLYAAGVSVCICVISNWTETTYFGFYRICTYNCSPTQKKIIFFSNVLGRVITHTKFFLKKGKKEKKKEEEKKGGKKKGVCVCVCVCGGGGVGLTLLCPFTRI